MPKGAHHHLHLTAACPIDFLIELTYEPIVYFNERDNMFNVSPLGEPEESGYINCNELRKYKPSADAFDEELKKLILLTSDEVHS
jgi:hypothetical protein